ncbi:MAG: DUF5518 domain-containing protein [Candidatus Aenigmatarchaeota archaeon]
MNYKLYLTGAIIYVAIAIILGMVVASLAPYAVLIGALIAGIYVGMKGATPMKAAIDGIIACVIGGIIGSLISIVAGPLMRPSTGVSFLDEIVRFLGGFLSPYVGAFAWFISAGLILGAIGGFIGKKIKK